MQCEHKAAQMFAVEGTARSDPVQGPATKQCSQPRLLQAVSGVAEALHAGAASEEHQVGKAREEKLRLESQMSHIHGPCLVV